MGGEFIIEYVVGCATYLVRSLGRLRKLRRTNRWQAIPAIVYDTKARSEKVETVYTYRFESGYYSGNESRDFFWTQSADDYISRFPTGAAVIIRVNPSDPERIAFRDDDQGL